MLLQSIPVLNVGLGPKRNVMFLQEKEGWLTAREKIDLGNKFVNPRKADTYLYYASLGSPDRRAWVEVELEE